MLDIKVTTENARVPVTIMHMSGDIDSSNFHLFQARVDELIAGGALHILFNLAKVPHLSSAGLRVIHNTFNKLRMIHKDVSDDELRKKMSTGAYKSPYVKVANLSSNIAEVFRLGGFEIYIEMFDNVDSAIASF
ncbi:MAG: STAS domain-containing protein [Anaerolineales bacterium]|nr:STAS domain-containing protein [Anaerolineales bacterium]